MTLTKPRTHVGPHNLTRALLGLRVGCSVPRCDYSEAVAKALPPAPAVQGSATSEAAARAQTDAGRQSKKDRILAAIVASGNEGLTDQKIQELTGIGGDTERIRRGELFKEGKIVKANRTRLTRSGLEAEVWIAR